MISFTVLLLICTGSVVLSLAKSKDLQKTIYDLKDIDTIFADYETQYNKSYNSSDERIKRFDIFKSNLKKLNKLNKESKISYGINQFTDLTFEEFNEMYLIADTTELNRYAKTYFIPKMPKDLPLSLDYRRWGYVSSVKDQGTCGAGYAFAAAGTVEGQYAKNYGELVADLSAQQVIDCNNYMECQGGSAGLAISFLVGQFGVMEEVDYPYVMKKQDRCLSMKKKSALKLSGTLVVNTEYSDDILKVALYEIGPLAIDIEVCLAFLHYSGGIFKRPCSGSLHSVLVVGYGFERDEQYWLIKNSWGTEWGEEGYMRISPDFLWEDAYTGIIKF